MYRSDVDLFNRAIELRIKAGQVMKELKATGGDWETAWSTHPVAVAYRALLREAWQRPALKESK